MKHETHANVANEVIKMTQEFEFEEPRLTAESIRELVEVLFPIEIILMFGSLFLIPGIWWITIPYHVIATSFALFVLWTAYQATKVIPPSIPFQRPMGVGFYLTGHVLQLFNTGDFPIWLLGICMIATPLAMLFLFEP